MQRLHEEVMTIDATIELSHNLIIGTTAIAGFMG